MGDRELGFFAGSSVGPVLAPFNYQIESGSRAAAVYLNLPDIKATTVFYNGGSFFENSDQYPNTKVIGVYENNLPAIIFVNYGKGKVLLSGVHFKYDPELLNPENRYIQKIIEPPHKGNDSRKELFKDLINLVESI